MRPGLYFSFEKNIVIYIVALHFLFYMSILLSVFLFLLSRRSCWFFLSIIWFPFYGFSSPVYELKCKFILSVFHLKFSNILTLFQPPYIYLVIIHEVLYYFTALILDLGQLKYYIVTVSNNLKFSGDKLMLFVKVTISNF